MTVPIECLSPLTLPQDPNAQTQAAQKDYVDKQRPSRLYQVAKSVTTQTSLASGSNLTLGALAIPDPGQDYRVQASAADMFTGGLLTTLTASYGVALQIRVGSSAFTSTVGDLDTCGTALCTNVSGGGAGYVDFGPALAPRVYTTGTSRTVYLIMRNTSGLTITVPAASSSLYFYFTVVIGLA